MLLRQTLSVLVWGVVVQAYHRVFTATLSTIRDPATTSPITEASGTVTVFLASDTTLAYAGYVTNLSTPLDRFSCTATNGCGVFIRRGQSCDKGSAATADHFLKTPPVTANTSAHDGHYDMRINELGHKSTRARATFSGLVATAPADIEGCVFLLYGPEGERVACGILTEKLPTSGQIFEAETVPLTSSGVYSSITAYIGGLSSSAITCFYGTATSWEPNVLYAFVNHVISDDCRATNGCSVRIHPGPDCSQSNRNMPPQSPSPSADSWSSFGYRAIEEDGKVHFVECLSTAHIDHFRRPLIIQDDEGSGVSCGLFKRVGRRELSGFDPIKSYIPLTLVTDQAALSFDQSIIQELLSTRTEESFQEAKRVYINGGNSKTIASLRLLDFLPLDVPAGTSITGSSIDGRDIVGTVNFNSSAGSTKISFRYPTSTGGRNQLDCRVGGLPISDRILKGCLVETGTLIVDGFALSIDYEYVIETDNKNGLTLRRLSSEANVTMRLGEGTSNSFISYFQTFFDYYGRADYADVLITAGFDKNDTTFLLGNVNLASHDASVEAQICKQGTTSLSVAMYIVRELEDALADCDAECPIGSCDHDYFPLDAAVAYYRGADDNSIHALANQRCSKFATCISESSVFGTAAVNEEVFTLFGEMQAILQSGECGSARPLMNRIASLIWIPLIQSTLLFAWELDENANPSASITDQNKAAGAIFAASVLPLIHECNQESASVIYDNMRFQPNPLVDFAAVKLAFESCYSALGISCEDIGGIVNMFGNAYQANVTYPCGTVISPISQNTVAPTDLDSNVTEAGEPTWAPVTNATLPTISPSPNSTKTESPTVAPPLLTMPPTWSNSSGTEWPTHNQTQEPTADSPTNPPVRNSTEPTVSPASEQPTTIPDLNTTTPTLSPVLSTETPTDAPTLNTSEPTFLPEAFQPTMVPLTISPSEHETSGPTSLPTAFPTSQPSLAPFVTLAPSSSSNEQHFTFTGLSVRLIGAPELSPSSRTAFERATEEFYRSYLLLPSEGIRRRRRLENLQPHLSFEEFETDVNATGQDLDTLGNTITYNQSVQFKSRGNIYIEEQVARDALRLSDEKAEQDYLNALKEAHPDFRFVSGVTFISLSSNSGGNSDAITKGLLFILIASGVAFCCCCVCCGAIFLVLSRRNRDDISEDRSIEYDGSIDGMEERVPGIASSVDLDSVAGPPSDVFANENYKGFGSFDRGGDDLEDSGIDFVQATHSHRAQQQQKKREESLGPMDSDFFSFGVTPDGPNPIDDFVFQQQDDEMYFAPAPTWGNVRGSYGNNHEDLADGRESAHTSDDFDRGTTRRYPRSDLQSATAPSLEDIQNSHGNNFFARKGRRMT